MPTGAAYGREGVGRVGGSASLNAFCAAFDLIHGPPVVHTAHNWTVSCIYASHRRTSAVYVHSKIQLVYAAMAHKSEGPGVQNVYKPSLHGLMGWCATSNVHEHGCMA